MPKEFDVPLFYRSPGITQIKRHRTASDPKRRDLTPTLLDFGSVRFKVARHFGFCYGVENAIEIAYRAIRENPDRRIFLLSEMIHNPEVNADLIAHGVRFLMDTQGSRLFPISSLTPDDVVVVPAFGTTIELQNEIGATGANIAQYDTTCPFVEKVWKRAAELGKNGFSVILHGKRSHEETRATFSHSKETAPTLIVRDMEDTQFLVSFMRGEKSLEAFWKVFARATSPSFDPLIHLRRVGVVNQTTMLATETQEIALTIKEALLDIWGDETIKEHFADTRDTLCYATYENQSATQALIASGADLAIVVGGYNSSNTSHLVELCQEQMPTFYIKDRSEILSERAVRHFDLRELRLTVTYDWLPLEGTPTIAVTSGASCPDAIVDAVIQHVASLFPQARTLEQVAAQVQMCA
ncbi:MAG: 4-hydroxy-3-methylbut-2-enyl diphosphate reductase [Deltaproteobacteria bacterium]|nr:4-hydroxy-3-methylbut-2-enyl diphosphate reductase [Deltaproteobacteria bacterium]